METKARCQLRNKAVKIQLKKKMLRGKEGKKRMKEEICKVK